MSDAPRMTPMDHVRIAEALMANNTASERDLKLAELHIGAANAINNCQSAEQSAQTMHQMRGMLKGLPGMGPEDV